MVPFSNLLQVKFFLPLVPGLYFAQLAARDVAVPCVRALDNLSQRDFFYGAGFGESYIKRMVPAGNRSMFVNCAEIGFVVEKNTTILNRTESHDGLLVVKLHPKRIGRRHRDFVVSIKTDELKGRLAGFINNSLDVAVGDANDGVATAIATTRTAKFQILLPVLLCHSLLRLATNCGNQKWIVNFLATFKNIFYRMSHG